MAGVRGAMCAYALRKDCGVARGGLHCPVGKSQGMLKFWCDHAFDIGLAESQDLWSHQEGHIPFQ